MSERLATSINKPDLAELQDVTHELLVKLPATGKSLRESADEHKTWLPSGSMNTKGHQIVSMHNDETEHMANATWWRVYSVDGRDGKESKRQEIKYQSVAVCEANEEGLISKIINEGIQVALDLYYPHLLEFSKKIHSVSR